jgi:tetratricopeptide (TPR) repeat protein
VDKLIAEGEKLYTKSEYSAALNKFQQGLTLAKKINYKQAESNALGGIGVVYSAQGRYPKALEYHRQSLVISQAVGDKSSEGNTLNNIGRVYDLLGQYPKALNHLKLQASLVVLSACDTGKGDLSGDGVIGLSRALAVAGVPSLAVSLWTVSDDSTKELMVAFYQNWYSKGMDKAQAVRQAMLEVMKTREKPIDWAAFTILGEAR